MLVWGAVTGEVKTFRFAGGPAIAVAVRPGSEYKPPRKTLASARAPRLPAPGDYRVRRYGR